MTRGLASLIGQTIVDIEVTEYDHLNDGERVDELYRITLADGKQLHFLCDGGDCAHYGTINEVKLNEQGKVPERYDENFAQYRGKFKSLK